MWYTPLVVGAALLLAFIPPILGLAPLVECIRRALLFLVVSCPCALVISVPMAFFGGIGGAASRGILFKGGNVFSPLAKTTHFVFDKTGTLTTGAFSVSEIVSYRGTREELLALAASAEYGSNHPVAKAILAAALTGLAVRYLIPLLPPEHVHASILLPEGTASVLIRAANIGFVACCGMSVLNRIKRTQNNKSGMFSDDF